MIACICTRVQNNFAANEVKAPYTRSGTDHLFERVVRLPDSQQEGKPMVQATSLLNQTAAAFPEAGIRGCSSKHRSRTSSEELRRHRRERPAHSDLDSPDRDSAAQMGTTSPLEGEVVAVEPGFHSEAEPVHLPRP